MQHGAGRLRTTTTIRRSAYSVVDSVDKYSHRSPSWSCSGKSWGHPQRPIYGS